MTISLLIFFLQIMKGGSTVNRMQKLVNRLNVASEAYYNGDEIMSDKVFDELYEQLKELERTTNIVLPNSPTKRVGYHTVSDLPKIKHKHRSLSLDKTKDKKIMTKWLGDEDGVLSWKLDGLTVILTYNHGRLINAATRGDGTLGEDITHNAIHFKGVPKYIKYQDEVIIRGEAIISQETFEQVNKANYIDKQYRNSRSMVSGATRLHSAEKSAKYGIEFRAFDLVNALGLGFNTVVDTFEFISTLGISVVDWCVVNQASIVDVIEKHEEKVSELGIPTDGLVVAYNDISKYSQIGSTAKYPKYAKAFKWADKMRTTILRDVSWSVAQSGLISPVAIFDPVEIEGTIVKRAGLHNITVMRELGLGIGDHIKVYKANMIIPKIHEDVEKSNNVILPEVCPVCKREVEHRLGVNKKSEFIYCTNEKCSVKGEK